MRSLSLTGRIRTEWDEPHRNFVSDWPKAGWGDRGRCCCPQWPRQPRCRRPPRLGLPAGWGWGWGGRRANERFSANPSPFPQQNRRGKEKRRKRSSWNAMIIKCSIREPLRTAPPGHSHSTATLLLPAGAAFRSWVRQCPGCGQRRSRQHPPQMLTAAEEA